MMQSTAIPQDKILDPKGFDSGRVVIDKCGVPDFIGSIGFPSGVPGRPDSESLVLQSFGFCDACMSALSLP